MAGTSSGWVGLTQIRESARTRDQADANDMLYAWESHVTTIVVDLLQATAPKGFVRGQLVISLVALDPG